MMRVGLFLLTNLAVLLVAGVVINLLGVGRFVTQDGLNLTSLLIYCAVFGFVGSLISLLLSKPMAKMSAGVQIIQNPSTPEERWLVETVQELAQKAGIGMPEVGIFPSHQSNAFATGWNRNAALVAVSEGMLRRFNRDEVRAVMAHEVGHVANGDMVTLALIQGVVNTFVMFFARIVGFLVDRALNSRSEGGQQGVGIGFYVASFVAEIIFGFLASMIVAWFSRRREFRADHAGATLADRQSMINALSRLKAEVENPNPMPDTLVAFGISAGKPSKLSELFATHPPLDVRIQTLKNGF
jgi:heat shock protein HtpX